MKEKDEVDNIEVVSELLCNTKIVESCEVQLSQTFKDELRVKLYETYITECIPKTNKHFFWDEIFNRKVMFTTSVLLGTFVVLQISGVPILSTLFTGAAISTVQAAEPEYVEGEVEIKHEGESSYHPFDAQTRVTTGDFIRTGTQSLMALHFSDGTIIRLAPSTEIHLKMLSSDSIIIEQKSGIIYSHVSELNEREYTLQAGDQIKARQGSIMLTKFLDSNVISITCLKQAISLDSSSIFIQAGKTVLLNSDKKAVDSYEFERSQFQESDFLTWNIIMDSQYGLSTGKLSDNIPPEVLLLQPIQSSLRKGENTPISFVVKDSSGVVWVRVNGQVVFPDTQGIYQTTSTMSNGEDSVNIMVKDNAWNVGSRQIIMPR